MSEKIPNPSEEQQLILDIIPSGQNIVIDAVAGSGKTTTILWIAKTFPNKNILQITYNSQLKTEVRDKVSRMSLSNIEIHSYHSLSVKYYKKEAHTDEIIANIIKENIPNNQNIPNYDIIILDEVQDMTLLYFSLVNKFINDSRKSPQLIFLGDKYQCIYKFKSADSRFLTLSHHLWESDVTEMYLNVSYRVTHEIAQFINKNMIGNKRLIAKKHGPNVEYIKCNPYKIHKLLAEKVAKYKPDDVFILCPSVKNKTPCRYLENALVAKGIPCYVPISDESKIDSSIITGKVVFTTFHQAKGRERALVIIYGFDDSYFKFYARDENPNECPNTLYVGVTRASKHLILIADEKNEQLPFLRNLEQSWYLSTSGNLYSKPEISLSKSRRDKEKIASNKHTTSVTDLVKFIKDYHLNDLALIINKLWENVEDISLSLDIPSKIEGQSGQYEEVSDLNGLAIPAFYQHKKNNINYLSEYIMSSNSKLVPMSYKKNKSTTIKDFLETANIYKAIRTGMHFKLAQIKNYTWISDKLIDICIENMNKHIGKIDQFELSLGNEGHPDIYYEFDSEFGDICLSGIIDGYDAKNGIIWEFKCVEDLQLEHYLQASIYQWIWNNTRTEKVSTKLFNIRTGEIYKLVSDNDMLDLLISILLRNKYEKELDTSDEHFIKKCIGVRHGSKETLELDYNACDYQSDEEEEGGESLSKCLLY